MSSFLLTPNMRTNHSVKFECSQVPIYRIAPNCRYSSLFLITLTMQISSLSTLFMKSNICCPFFFFFFFWYCSWVTWHMHMFNNNKKEEEEEENNNQTEFTEPCRILYVVFWFLLRNRYAFQVIYDRLFSDYSQPDLSQQFLQTFISEVCL